MSIFPKNNLKCFHCHSVYLRWLWAQRARRRFCAKLINVFLFALYNFKLHFWMQRRTVLSDNDLFKYSQAHVAMIMVAWWFLKYYHLRVRWSCAFSSSSCPWHLLTEISPDTLNLFMIWWTVDGERPKLFANLCWETLVFELTDNSLMMFGTNFCGIHNTFFLCEPRPILVCKD